MNTAQKLVFDAQLPLVTALSLSHWNICHSHSMAFQTHWLASGFVPCLVQENISVSLFKTLPLLKMSTTEPFNLFSYHLSDILLVCILYCLSNEVCKLDDLEQHKFIFLHFWRAEVQNRFPWAKSISPGWKI